MPPDSADVLQNSHNNDQAHRQSSSPGDPCARTCQWFTVSIICLFIPVLSIILVSKVTPVLGLLLGIIVCVTLNFTKYKSVIQSLSNGVTSSAAPIVNVCGAVGFGTVLKMTGGFQLSYDLLGMLPPLYGGILTSLIFCSVIGSSSTHLPIVLPNIVEKFSEAGLSPALGHRMTTLSVFTYKMPHNAGPVNAITLSRISFTKAALIYFKTAAVPGACAMLVALIAIWLGLVA